MPVDAAIERVTPGGAETPLRSLLFVPGDSERKLAKCATAGADALVLDLEDSVAAGRKAFARMLVAEFLEQHADRRAGLWVRINPLGDAEFRKDVERIVPARPRGLVLPKITGPEDIALVGARLTHLELLHGIDAGSTQLLPIATETPAGVFGLGTKVDRDARLAALSWGAEDLSVALGAVTNIDAHGEWLPPYQLARSLCLLAAAAAGVRAIDTVYTNLRDAAGLERQAAAAHRDGFAGKLAIHPDQVPVLNDAFRPTAQAIEHARRVVEAFGLAEETGALGVVTLDGRMLDRPHLTRAQRTLGLAAALDHRGKAPK